MKLRTQILAHPSDVHRRDRAGCARFSPCVDHRPGGRRRAPDNLDLRAASYEVDKARGRLLQAGLWPNPELELSTTTDRTFNDEGERTSAAGFQQAFPISGRLRFAKRVSRVDVAQAMAEIRNRERLLIGEVQRDFLSVLLLRQQTRGEPGVC